MQSAEKEARTIEPWAAGVAISTLALVTLVAIFTAWDRAHTAELDTVITPTAVGDTHFVAEPGKGSGPLGIKYEGHALDMVAEMKMRDSRLLREGMDDSGVYAIYRPADDADALPKDHYYVKAADNLFIEAAKE
ncbi:MAG TPA: hypothetical protein VHY22_15630 [Chthoniobacteraceae bacterium]|jgi:hypothetical protein|nr:hypothetical protein [Chthoniobacteraceae bacterium]